MIRVVQPLAQHMDYIQQQSNGDLLFQDRVQVFFVEHENIGGGQGRRCTAVGFVSEG